jgi:hypothetical protein
MGGNSPPMHDHLDRFEEFEIPAAKYRAGPPNGRGVSRVDVRPETRNEIRS